MVIVLIDDDDLDRRACERVGRFEPAETRADNHDARTVRRRRAEQWLRAGERRVRREHARAFGTCSF